MSEGPTITERLTERIGPGRLILIVGPSGSGKDTLIGLVREACASDPKVVFPRRIVTREASEFECNETLGRADFEAAVAANDFAMHWEAHGHGYGLARCMDDNIRAGCSVVVNVSRSVIDAARRAYRHVVVVAITAPADVLAERIKARGRQSDGPIENRLHREVPIAEAPEAIIHNVGPAAEHARELLRIIKG